MEVEVIIMHFPPTQRILLLFPNKQDFGWKRLFLGPSPLRFRRLDSSIYNMRASLLPVRGYRTSGISAASGYHPTEGP